MDIFIGIERKMYLFYSIIEVYLVGCFSIDIKDTLSNKIPSPVSYSIMNKTEVNTIAMEAKSNLQSGQTLNHDPLRLQRFTTNDTDQLTGSDVTDSIDDDTVTQPDPGLYSKNTSAIDWKKNNISSIYNATQLLNKLLQSYDNRLRPGFGGPPIRVDVNLNIRSMGPISERDMSYQMDCYFRQIWIDTRLTFDGPLNIMPVSINILDRIWKPDTHFLNGRRSLLHTVTSPNKLLRIHRNGTILYSMRLTIKASCPMYLENFPMDTQTCPLKFGSHGYNTDDVVYHWTHGAHKSIKMADDMTLSQFDLIGFPHINENITQVHNHFGEFSVLSVRFTLRRHMGYFLINVYVPCSLLVICSWVGFWINREATSDRIALGVTTVLTMAFLKIENRVDLPEVSYSTALDYFMGTCFALVLATIIEFAGVHFFTKHGSGEIEPDSDEDDDTFHDNSKKFLSSGKHRYSIVKNSGSLKHRQTNDNNGAYFVPEQSPSTENPSAQPRESCCYKFWNCVKGSSKYRNLQMRRPSTNTSGGINSVSKIDIAARVFFPLIFAAFNAFYWSLYIVYGDNEVLM